MDYGLLRGTAAYNFELFLSNYGLVWGMVACYFGLLGFEGSFSSSELPKLRPVP